MFKYGVWRLNFGMYHWKFTNKKPSFDPTAKTPPYPYDKKNFYVNAFSNSAPYSNALLLAKISFIQEMLAGLKGVQEFEGTYSTSGVKHGYVAL